MLRVWRSGSLAASALLVGSLLAPAVVEAAPQRGPNVAQRVRKAQQRPRGSQIQRGRGNTMPRRPQARVNAAENPRVLERLMNMRPNQRETFLQNSQAFQRMPAAQQKQLRARLAQLDKMEPADRKMLLQRYQMFQGLSSQQRDQARRLYDRWQKFDAPRREAIMKELQSLRGMRPLQRRRRVQSEDFAAAYSEEEVRVLRGIVQLQSRSAANSSRR